jgi:hypothetical protein
VAIRQIDGPPGGEFLTTGEAAGWIGIGKELFERLAADELAWMRPVMFGSKRTWNWKDVLVFAHLFQQRRRQAEKEAT